MGPKVSLKCQNLTFKVNFKCQLSFDHFKLLKTRIDFFKSRENVSLFEFECNCLHKDYHHNFFLAIFVKSDPNYGTDRRYEIHLVFMK